MCVRSAPLRSPAPHASPNARHTHPLPTAPDFSLRREEVDSQRFDADLSPEAVAKLTEQERLLHQEAAGKAAQARLKAARAAERAARQGGGASSSSSSAAAGGGGGGSHVASEEDEAEDEEEEEDDDEDYGEADKKGGKRKGAAAKEEDKRIKVQGGVVSTGRKGKGPEDIYTKLLKEKNASELKVSAQEAVVKKALEELNAQCDKDEAVSKVLKAMRDQLVPKAMGAKEGIEKINSFILALQVRSAPAHPHARSRTPGAPTHAPHAHPRSAPAHTLAARRPGASTSPPPWCWTRRATSTSAPTAPTMRPWRRRGPRPSAAAWRRWAPAPGKAKWSL